MIFFRIIAFLEEQLSFAKKLQKIGKKDGAVNSDVIWLA